MGREQILDRMTFIMKGDVLERVNVEYDDEGNPVISIDLHEYSKYEASKLIQYILLMYKFSFTLIAIHGYNHGTSIKEYIYNSLKSNRITNRFSPAYNPGITYINVV